MRLKRNKFDLSHEAKATCDMGQLVPVLSEVALPGDKWRMNVDCVMRVAPLLAPLMHNVKLYFHTFSVPFRLLMNESEWESFITGGPDGNDATVYPTITFPNGINEGELGDYLGFATNKKATGTEEGYTLTNYTVSALPFRAYALIINEWYRNQSLQDKLPLSLEAGNDIVTNTALQYRNWRKDYFTSALPSQQRGSEVYLPMGDMSVVGNGNVLGLQTLDAQGNIARRGLGTYISSEVVRTGANTNIDSGTAIEDAVATNSWTGAGKGLGVDTRAEYSGLIADGSTSQGTSLNDFRWANAVQSFMELQMRGGARYVETLMSQFGVRSSDARLQRPEYLGGGASQLVVTPVLQTSSSDTVSPQGNMAGQAFSAQRSRQFTHFFEEHCIVMTLMSIMPDTNYQQGTPRKWLWRTRYDFPWPMFSHTSEQEVFNEELIAMSTERDKEVFGFQPRYEEMRRLPSRVHGEFKSSLNYWTMARIFDYNNPPELNSEFVTSDPTKRINAVTSEHNCWCNIFFNIKALRPLPKQGTPSLKTGV